MRSRSYVGSVLRGEPHECLIPLVVRALSLVAAAGIAALIIFVHTADTATLGAREVVARAAVAIAQTHTSAVQVAARIGLSRSGTR